LLPNSGSHRVQKMASLLRSELARLLITEVSDPRLQHLAITEVEVTRDLREAKVFFDGGQGADPKEIKRGLSKAVSFLRRRLGQNLELKHVPELKFQADGHGDNLKHLFQVMDDVKKSESSEVFL